MRGIATGAWGILNRRFQPWPWLELVGELVMAALALSWILLATLACQVSTGIILAGFFAYLGFLSYLLWMGGYGRRKGKVEANPIKRPVVSKLSIVVYRPFSTTSTSFGLLGMIILFSAYFFLALRFTVAESTVAWMSVLVYLFSLVFRPGRPKPPRSGPPPTSPPPKLSPSGTPVLPIFPDDILIGADEKEIPLERTA